MNRNTLRRLGLLLLALAAVGAASSALAIGPAVTNFEAPVLKIAELMTGWLPKVIGVIAIAGAGVAMAFGESTLAKIFFGAAVVMGAGQIAGSMLGIEAPKPSGVTADSGGKGIWSGIFSLASFVVIVVLWLRHNQRTEPPMPEDGNGGAGSAAEFEPAWRRQQRELPTVEELPTTSSTPAATTVRRTQTDTAQPDTRPIRNKRKVSL